MKQPPCTKLIYTLKNLDALASQPAVIKQLVNQLEQRGAAEAPAHSPSHIFPQTSLSSLRFNNLMIDGYLSLTLSN